jgi:hypothetical protein
VQSATAPGHPATAIEQQAIRHPRTGAPAESGRRWGTFEAEVVNVTLQRPGGGATTVFDGEDGLQAVLEVAAPSSLEKLSVEVSLVAQDGTLLWRGTQPIPSASTVNATLTLDRLGLADGNYRLDVAVFAAEGRVCCDFQKGLHGFAVRSPGATVGLVRPAHSWTVDPPIPKEQGTQAER